MVAEPGETFQFTAHLTDVSGLSVMNAPVVWSSSDESVAVVDENGLATALSRGSVVVWVAADGLTAGATFGVDPDTVPPVLVDAELSTERVGVQNQSGEITLTVRLSDDRSGVSAGLAQFSGPSGAAITAIVQLSLQDGGANTGVWQGPLSIPANTGVGTWTLALIQAEDSDGNVSVWREEDLRARGLDLAFEVAWVS
jgi:Big-like domain-containing protein